MTSPTATGSSPASPRRPAPSCAGSPSGCWSATRTIRTSAISSSSRGERGLDVGRAARGQPLPRRHHHPGSFLMDAIALGATLYIPASRTDLAAILGGRHPNLRSAVLCLEDSTHHQDVPRALANLAALLRNAARAERPGRPGPVRPAARFGDARPYPGLRGRRDPGRLRHPQGLAGQFPGLSRLPRRRPPPADADAGDAGAARRRGDAAAARPIARRPRAHPRDPDRRQRPVESDRRPPLGGPHRL